MNSTFDENIDWIQIGYHKDSIAITRYSSKEDVYNFLLNDILKPMKCIGFNNNITKIELYENSLTGIIKDEFRFIDVDQNKTPILNSEGYF